MSYLLKAKQQLAARATALYSDMRHDLDFKEYGDHYSRLGEALSSIDQTETWSELLQSILKGDYDHVGMFSDDDENLEEFLAGIFKK